MYTCLSLPFWERGESHTMLGIKISKTEETLLKRLFTLSIMIKINKFNRPKLVELN